MPNFLDLFCGAGGLGLGLKQAGFTPFLSLDNDENSISTMSGYSDHLIKNIDIIDFIEQLETKTMSLPDIDLVAGGPPCQGFCSINPKRQKDDPRNSMVDAFLHIIKLVKPKAVLIENVTGLLSLANGFAIKKAESLLKSLGYHVHYKVLQAAHYGAPQNRWRLFIVGLNNSGFEFPVPEYKAEIRPNFFRGKELTFDVRAQDLFAPAREPVTVWDAISDLPNIQNGQKIEIAHYKSPPKNNFQKNSRAGMISVCNHQSKKLEEVNMERIRFIKKEGDNWKSLPPHLTPKNLKKLAEKHGVKAGGTSRFRRLEKNGFFTTILTSVDPYWGCFIHPNQDRVISVREAARAQTFPDSIEFKGGITSQYQQVGNAVPVCLSEAVGKELLKVM